MFKILLVDDIQLWTELLLDVFTDHPIIQFVGSVATEPQLWERLKETQPDLLLLDLCLDDRKPVSLRLAKQLKQTYPTLRIVLLTQLLSNARLIQEANKLGLDGYLSKQITKEELTQFLLRAQKGERVFSNIVKDILIEINQSGFPELTPREIEIVTRIDKEMKRAAIIADLNIKSENTYDSHLHHIKEKLGAKTTTEVRRKAAELGYI